MKPYYGINQTSSAHRLPTYPTRLKAPCTVHIAVGSSWLLCCLLLCVFILYHVVLLFFQSKMEASLSSPPASSPSCLPFTFATLVASAQVETVMMNAMNTLKDKNLNPGLGWEITDGMNVNLVQQNITDSCIIPTPGGGTFGVVGVAAGTSGRWSVGRGVTRNISACSTANHRTCHVYCLFKY